MSDVGGNLTKSTPLSTFHFPLSDYYLSMSSLLLLLLLLCVASAGTPVLVSSNVRGKRYAISASTVAEVTSAIEREAGLEASEQDACSRLQTWRRGTR